METEGHANRSDQPTAAEARAALQEVERAENSLNKVANPWWLTLGLAGYMAAISLALPLPRPWFAVICALLVVGLAALTRFAKKRVGFIVRFRGVHWALLVAGAAICVAALGSGFFLDDDYGYSVWFLVAAVNAAVILGIDLFYRVRARRAA